MTDDCHIIASIVKMDKFGDDFTVYYADDPTRLDSQSADGVYAGGFEEDMSLAKSFDCMQDAMQKIEWLTEVYGELEADMYTISMPRKLLFKTRLQG
jgi:hypothetical protein